MVSLAGTQIQAAEHGGMWEAKVDSGWCEVGVEEVEEGFVWVSEYV